MLFFKGWLYQNFSILRIWILPLGMQNDNSFNDLKAHIKHSSNAAFFHYHKVILQMKKMKQMRKMRMPFYQIGITLNDRIKRLQRSWFLVH